MAIGKLTALRVKNLTTPGRYNDGGGLYLQVRDAERRSWLFRFKLHGRPRQMGLGPLHDVPLAEARDAAQRCRKLVRDKVDPIDQRRSLHAEIAARAGAYTFRDVAARYIAAHEKSWRNPKHRLQWGATLATYVYPVFGSRPVAAIETGDVTRVLEPIWHEKPETAARVRGRIEAILDYAKTRGWRSGENPARWKGHLEHALPARAKVAKLEHHPALPWAEIGAFVADLREQDGTAARALEFVILTAARTGEVLGARWSEIDLVGKIWTVPAGRMKAGSEHRVPLSEAAVALLRFMRPEGVEAEAFVFPGAKAGAPLSNMSLLMLLRRMGRGDLTTHGFRSTFRDWAAERTTYQREVAEAALAHTVGNKVEAAYRRGDLFEKRRRLMEDWAGFCTKLRLAPHDNVAEIRRESAA